ncbi:hypothetical protein FH972_020969 [Carpinus fangiana]|uniref:Glutathione hydrolase n=1 Tax=Carpinus fangiana TaxID=176857 RepID=A0A5N6KMZ7_9ROSI|nr:hypothetical protein FH972_020969 [Carpinus fangiana]
MPAVAPSPCSSPKRLRRARDCGRDSDSHWTLISPDARVRSSRTRASLCMPAGRCTFEAAHQSKRRTRRTDGATKAASSRQFTALWRVLCLGRLAIAIRLALVMNPTLRLTYFNNYHEEKCIRTTCKDEVEVFTDVRITRFSYLPHASSAAREGLPNVQSIIEPLTDDVIGALYNACFPALGSPCAATCRETNTQCLKKKKQTMLSIARLAAAALITLPHLVAADEYAVSPVLDPYRNKLGAVASESSECTEIGTDLLKRGGNAADALVGTVFCIGVVAMYHSGIGGGGFMLVRSSNGSYEFIDFRETAPAAAFQDMYKDNVNASITGGLASGVPGELRGLQHLHDGYGILPWATVMQGAIKLARNGFRVSSDLVRYMASATAGQDNFLVNNPTWAIDFAPEGTLLKLNDTITRKRYADTLETIAKRGPDAFYTGAIARATIAALQRENGTMTTEDLANYTVAIRQPAQINYRDYRLTSCSAPASGVVALSAMNIVSGYEDFGWPESLNISTHRLDEAMRFAYGERGNLGDPLFVVNLQSYENSMIAPDTGAAIRAKITNRAQNVSYYDPAGLEVLPTPGTSHIVAADASGLAISVTTTINLLFGSQLMVPETGVIMNDEMNDFSIPGSSNAFGYIPSPNNYIVPGKRPLSSISPTIVEHASNGTLYFVVGAAGGSRITTATIQNLWHVLDQNMTSAQALAQARLHDQLVPAVTSFEYTYNNETVAFMRDAGHNISYIEPGESTAQALRLLSNGTFEAAGEPRQLNSLGSVV